MFSKKVVIAVVLAAFVVAGATTTAGILWQSFTTSLTEVEDAIDNYMKALNNHDAEGAWRLMSPTLRSGKPYSEFEEFVQNLENKHWKANIQSITSRSVETENGRTTATFILIAKITETNQIVGTETYTEIWAFSLVNINGRWMMNEWLYQ